jgi:hypothetical protein
MATKLYPTRFGMSLSHRFAVRRGVRSQIGQLRRACGTAAGLLRRSCECADPTLADGPVSAAARRLFRLDAPCSRSKWCCAYRSSGPRHRRARRSAAHQVGPLLQVQFWQAGAINPLQRQQNIAHFCLRVAGDPTIAVEPIQASPKLHPHRLRLVKDILEWDAGPAPCGYQAQSQCLGGEGELHVVRQLFQENQVRHR